MKQRGYSHPLQRRIADFGADMAFGQVDKKRQEHYGITVPENGIRVTTLRHARAIQTWQADRLGTLHAEAKD